MLIVYFHIECPTNGYGANNKDTELEKQGVICKTGVLVEDVHLNRKQLSRQVFLRCQHYSTALQILEQYPNAILTIPQNILSHLHVSPLLNIFDVPVKLPQMNIGIFWHKNLMENKRNHFLRNEIYKIFA